jgi:YVTN family beta-propeller protein
MVSCSSEVTPQVLAVAPLEGQPAATATGGSSGGAVQPARSVGPGATDGASASQGSSVASPAVESTPTPGNSPAPSPSPTAAPEVPAPPKPATGPSDTLRLQRIHTITGGLTPKSVVASQTGLFFAQNMIYGHNIRVYNRAFELVDTVRDRVTPSDFGYAQYPDPVRGGPVEAAFSPDASTAYVSNYSMYGRGFSHPGRDNCLPGEGIDRSFVYRIDTRTFKKTDIVRVGQVPKFLAVSPDGSTLVVSNWCSGTISIIDLDTFTVRATVPVGWHPRGIVFDTSTQRVYVAVWDRNAVVVVNLATLATHAIKVGKNPRHLAISPSGRWLYASLNGAGKIAKIDLKTETPAGKVFTGAEPRSMTIAEDGRSLYVVNYSSDTISKVRTRDMRVLQTVSVGHHPIGITYDNATRNVWVALYSGSLAVFNDR